jgi:hypothetical protein
MPWGAVPIRWLLGRCSMLWSLGLGLHALGWQAAGEAWRLERTFGCGGAQLFLAIWRARDRGPDCLFLGVCVSCWRWGSFCPLPPGRESYDNLFVACFLAAAEWLAPNPWIFGGFALEISGICLQSLDLSVEVYNASVEPTWGIARVQRRSGEVRCWFESRVPWNRATAGIHCPCFHPHRVRCVAWDIACMWDLDQGTVLRP